MGIEIYLMKLLPVLALGVIVAWGLNPRSNSYCIKFFLVTAVLVAALAAAHHVLGQDIFALLALDLPSKSSAAMFALYSGALGALLKIISSMIRKRIKGSASQ